MGETNGIGMRTLFLLMLVCSSAIIMANSASGAGDSAAVQIVYTEKPEGDEPEAFHIKTLASVLGSEEAAKEAIIYTYKHAATGFSAKLTPEQASEISKKPGVLQVVPSKAYHLHSDPAKPH